MTRPSKPAGGNQRLGFRASHVDNKRAIQLSLAQHALASGRPTPEHQLAISTAKPKRERGPNKPRTVEQGKSEAAVQNEVIRMLVEHPRVHLLLRTNSGVAGDNFVSFTSMHLPKHLRVSWPAAEPEMKFSDLHVIMDDARIFACEVKEEFWKMSHGIGEKAYRELCQSRYLAHMRKCGGIGIFATSVEDVRVALTAAGY